MMLLHVLDGGPVTPADLWRRWRVEPAALALILIVAAAYTAGLRRLWIRARAHRVVSTNRAIAFYLGIATLLVHLGATVPTGGLYVLDSRYDDPSAYDEWLARAQPVVDSLLRAAPEGALR